MRTPDEFRLQQIADFFGVTVAYLRADHNHPDQDFAPAQATRLSQSPLSADNANPARPDPEYRCPFYSPPKSGESISGQMRSLCWLAERFFADLREFGISVRLHPSELDSILQRFARYKYPRH